MKHFFTQFFVLCTLSLMALAVSVQAQVMDVSKIADPKTKAAVEKINELQAGIKELQIDEMTSVVCMDMGNGPTTITTKTVIMERRPDLFFKKDKISGGILDGTQMGVLLDGKKMWQMSVPGAGQLKMMEEGLRKNNTPQADIEKMTAPFRSPHVSQCDLQRLKDAGVLDKLKMSTTASNPIMMADPAGLKLEKETPLEWVFSTTGAPGQPAFTFTYGKADGVCIRIESHDSKMNLLATVDKYAVNPTPPIKDAYFTYTPSPNVKVMDATDQMIGNMKNAGAIMQLAPRH